MDMFRNFFTTAIRNLLKNKFYTLINIFGLTIGLTTGLFILLWVQDELSYDRQNKQAEHIYRIYANMGTTEKKEIWGGVQAPLSSWAKREIPGVKEAVRILHNYSFNGFKSSKNIFIEQHTVFADPSFLNVFTTTWLKGDREHCMKDPNSVLLSFSSSHKYFGNQDPIGKVIHAGIVNLTVTGVFADLPENSSLKFDMIFPISLYAQGFKGNGAWKTIEEDWGNYAFDTYLLLKDKTNLGSIENQLAQIHNKNQRGSKNTYLVKPLLEMHLRNPDGTSAPLKIVEMFVAAALFVLLIASINYVNLSTARSMLRFKEVSVRKIIGASKLQLFSQFIIETVILFGIACAGTFILVILLSPQYDVLTGKHLRLDLSNVHLWMLLFTTLMVTLLAVSIYPALLLTSFKPILALKGIVFKPGSALIFRRGLVITQFVFSIILIVSTLLAAMQLKYIRSKELGYDRQHTFTFAMGERMQKHYRAAKDQLKGNPSILSVSSASGNIMEYSNSTGDFSWDGKDPRLQIIIAQISIEETFIPSFKIKLAAGENFKGLAADSSHFILNQAAVKATGFLNPVGKSIIFHGLRGTVIGVVKDFHFESLKEPIKPLIFYYSPDQNGQIYIKTTAGRAHEAMAAAASVWKSFNQGYPFDAKFLDEIFDEQYKSDTRTGLLFQIFAWVAITISCLGLFALAAFTAQVKTKEIGIRKVLGASVGAIVTLLASEFMFLIVIATAIGSPIAWFAMHSYLQDFAYRIEIPWWVFAISGLVAVLVSLLTVSAQSFKAALANPARSLKSD